MSRLLLLSAAAVLLSTVTAFPTPPNEFSGRGKIWVLNSTDLLDALPSDRIGCLDAHGALTFNRCAVFTQLDQAPHTLSSRIGSCGFRDENMPTNKDSYYGRDSHAWACQPGDAAVRSPPDENYYTLVSSPRLQACLAVCSQDRC
ncbi:hypothetical protein B0T26DRAFT_714492 [Lasiosphaeria miniovina]|uniref:Uncharacterized protein n=1 Tax=Lasiosphaeria miniovina TaxID=1954250 RepID=A0AA40ABC2_9PEZI|nr:uncharacterized protein B0T26DRAFT_714492 [Lasiosphaeria miniovina]KAK0712498.1 hypothetical protein B0T26DRAFT_714492 [Lasiosphaeria miniovina]